jgi:K+:H+ antiporter
MEKGEPMPHLDTLIVQISVIIIAARGMGWIFKRIRQPQVVGEMAAGIMLGPSLLGWLWPAASAKLFPADSLAYLNALSQIGLLLFMFLVGLELDPGILRRRGRIAIVTSNVSIALPFLLGALLAYYLYPILSDREVAFSHFALFLGTAMSITAFPVLARILTERRLTRTQVGSVAIACAAVDDVTAWCMLAGVVFLVRATAMALPFWLMPLGAALYVVFLAFVVRPFLREYETRYRLRGAISQNLLAMVLLLVFASAWVTEQLGVHALFGAFLIGAMMPKDRKFAQALSAKFIDLTTILLLPLFFAFTGLRTKIGLISGLQVWLIFGLILAVATAGKFGGAMISARLGGMTWREAGAIGILMNTRGLIELVVLNVGLDVGVISPQLFTMLVLMALVTTFITTPLLDWIYPAWLPGEEPVAVEAAPTG